MPANSRVQPSPSSTIYYPLEPSGGLTDIQSGLALPDERAAATEAKEKSIAGDNDARQFKSAAIPLELGLFYAPVQLKVYVSS